MKMDSMIKKSMLGFLLALAFSFLNPVSGSAMIIDNTNSGFSTVGTWGSSSYSPGFYGTNYRYAAAGTGVNRATWRFPVTAGQYTLSAQWAADPNRASNATYRVYNNGVEIGNQVFDQQINGGVFNLFDTVYTVTDGTLDIKLTDAANGFVIADAVQAVLESGGNLAPNGVINSPSSNMTILAGGNVTFAGTGTDPDSTLPLRFLWNFGSGSGVSNMDVEDPGTVVFNNAGVFTVTFTVTDAGGLADPTPATVVVTVNTSSSEVIIDNKNSGFSTVGTWGLSSYSPGGYEDNYRFAAAGTGANRATWSFPVTAGQYALFAQWAADDNRASNATYRVFNNGVEIGSQGFNQQENGGVFNPFDTVYTFTGGTLDIRLTDAANGYVIADAVKLNFLGSGGNLAPNGQIDTPAGGVSISVGESLAFTGTGTDPDGNLPLTHLWSFGDPAIPNRTVEDPGPVVFNTPGTFTVTYTVTDSLGLSDASPATVVVNVLSVSTEPVIIDNTNSGFSTVGTWGTSSSVPGYYGTNYRWIGVSPGLNEARWSVDLSEGKYDIYAQWASYSNRASNAKHTILNNGTPLRDVWADQRANGGQFNSLGTFYLGGGTQRVALSELGKMNGIIIADAIKFENICQADPCLYIKAPQDYHLQTSGQLAAAANIKTVNAVSQYGVRFVLDEGTASQQVVTDLTSPFTAAFNIATPSTMEHTLDAYLTNSSGATISGLNSHDYAMNLGIGRYYVSMGDSTTDGIGDDDITDDISLDMRNGGGGYTPVLNNLMTAKTGGVPHTIVNEGVPGTLSVQGAAIVGSLLQKHLLAQRFLVEYGINDSGAFPPVPSGLGLDRTSPDYPGTFKANMQQIIDAVNLGGRKACLAKTSIVLGDNVDSGDYPDPDTGARNIKIKEYNQVIAELVADPANQITVSPPDFYSKFNEIVDSSTGQRRYEIEYIDNYHMNGSGYRTKAHGWEASLPLN